METDGYSSYPSPSPYPSPPPPHCWNNQVKTPIGLEQMGLLEQVFGYTQTTLLITCFLVATLCGVLFFCFFVCLFTSCFLSASGHGEVPCRWRRWVSAVVKSVLTHHAADVPSQLKAIKTQLFVKPVIFLTTRGMSYWTSGGVHSSWTQLFQRFTFC